ncbi:pyruvate/2-oxoglutarate dehydrogenase complex dihydrolipoamide dehydrogenase (E3) component [Paraburkholderia bannensis]|uniref:Pyruvate/2-oxoglutarate dehydrogenase complex dihydrolipoamide dehydrogenase (E3) component n=1 Tax=Paraburkholderia bannensis TaxID=765414 RepID=A0A7W9WSB5_9BURK|nr:MULTISPECIES: FAD-dependent oxidoreductase [Paraburkholderia]MBB3261539.1 pyruvate/2-oxoglutarate dehydrogenase complex dihydrolipoamide dehydrogenase (E3) component [Paraburkholderia sp. WP4_3_2]MBB6102147.1 pyruvate/2-oxoglutarate dehydrogenase complex dihydrolipoamide dehydrogenase (E3) component [Paraburkholderia bannensis]
MPDIKHFDYLFLGGGKGGKSLAMDLARKGKRVALIERGMIGGSCINVACIPSKTLIQNARNMQVWRSTSGEPDLHADMTRVHTNVRAVVDGMIGINRRAFEQSGLEFVLGTGRFVAPRRILVRLDNGSEQLFSGDEVYINTGTVAVIPDIPGLRDSRPMTHIEALNLEILPEHLIVLGGGYIGLELAQAFRRLGSQVTLVHNMPRVAMREDEDVSLEIQSAFEEAGIRLSLATTVTRVDGDSGKKVTVELDDGSSIEGTHLLVAAGRQPVTNELGLDLAGVDLDERGYIKVDDTLATTAANTWAIGEVAGSPMFTHASFDDYRVLKARIEGRSSSTASRIVPYALFTEPELGRVGINESDAKALGITVRVARLPMMAVPRARTNGTTRGFMKALVAPDSGRILGFTMVGSGAGEVTSVVQMAMLGELPYTAVRDAIIAHPLLAEGLNLLFATLD